jgi:hypothetical protein
MGERLAAEESYDSLDDGAYLRIEGNLPINDSVCLHSFNANNLIYFHNSVFGYDKCKINFTLR